MKVLLAVAKDLISFAKISLLAWLKPTKNQAEPLLLAVGMSEVRNAEIERTKINSESVVQLDSPALNANFGWISVSEAAVFSRPLWVEDSVLGKLKLGEKVSLEQFSGRFAFMKQERLSGFVLKEEVETDKQKIWPSLVPRTVYLAGDAETIRIRALLRDEFFTTSLFLPLRDTEWVSYSLLKHNLSLPWREERPRTPGSWHKLLRGVVGVSVVLEARTGSVMEVFANDLSPFLAYVEAVTVDGVVKVSSVGRYREGEYQLENLTVKDLQELQPVFIVRQ